MNTYNINANIVNIWILNNNRPQLQKEEENEETEPHNPHIINDDNDYYRYQSEYRGHMVSRVIRPPPKNS